MTPWRTLCPAASTATSGSPAALHGIVHLHKPPDRSEHGALLRAAAQALTVIGIVTRRPAALAQRGSLRLLNASRTA